MYNIPKCPYCRSSNIEPIGPKLFHCRDCKKDFEQAVVEQAPPQQDSEKKGE